MAEEKNLRGSGPVEKVREPGGSEMVIGEILCSLLLHKLPILSDPFSLYPLYGLVAHKSRKQAKCDGKGGIFRHNNRKDLGIPNLFMFQVGTC